MTFTFEWELVNLLGGLNLLYASCANTDNYELDGILTSPHVEFEGAVVSNGFITPNIVKFATKDGQTVPPSPSSYLDFYSHPEEYELNPVNNKTTFYLYEKEMGGGAKNKC